MEFRNVAEAQGVQRRALASGELRTAGDEFALVGYAAKYNVLSHELPGGFREKIAPGTFNRSIREGADVVFLWNHNPDEPLGRTTNGTLRLESDSVGLRFHCKLNPNSQRHKDIYQNVLTGLTNQCSFAFTVPQGGDLWETGRDDENEECQIRTLRDVDLLDCSAVTYPAYPSTAVDARKKYGYSRKRPVDAVNLNLDKRVEEMRALLRKAERALQNVLSHSQADALLRAQTSATYQDDSGIYSYDSLRKHMQTCSDLANCSYAIATTVNDLLDNWPGANDGDLEEEDDSLRARTAGDRKRHKEFHDMHKLCHRMLGEVCRTMADARLTVNQIID